ncbi:unnamed protein product [Heligmosomoides polygyrus]|uniref:Transposase n=1 Tax=Heligmosomoides polygyrus TaxID=6339 RepID=A0A183GM11_HELPZ|nr:unnamed protein product [Heligmosomoides polygyrus]
MYGTVRWPVTREAEKPLSVMKTKMLRWTTGPLDHLWSIDRIRNGTIRQKFGVTSPAEKMRSQTFDSACQRLVRMGDHGQVRVDEDNAVFSPAVVCSKEQFFSGAVGRVKG